MPALPTPRRRLGRAPALALALTVIPVAAPVAQSTWLHAWQPTPLSFGNAPNALFAPGSRESQRPDVVLGTEIQLGGGGRRSTWWTESTGIRPDDIALEPGSTRFEWQLTTTDGRIVGSEVLAAGGWLHVVFDPSTNRKTVLPQPPGGSWSTHELLAVSPAGLLLAVAALNPTATDTRSVICDLNAAVPTWTPSGIAPPAPGTTRVVTGGDVGADGSIAVAYQDRDAGGNVRAELQVRAPDGTRRIEVDAANSRLVDEVRVLADGTTRFLYTPAAPAGASPRIGRRSAQGIADLLVPGGALLIRGLQCDDRGRLLCYEPAPGGLVRAGLLQDGRFQAFDALCTDALALQSTTAAWWIDRQGRVLLPASSHAGNPVDAVLLRPSIQPILSFHIDATRPDAAFDCIYDSSQTDDMVLRIDGAVPGVLWFLYFGDSRFGVPLGLPFHIGITDANGSDQLRFPRAAFSPALFASQPDVLFLASALDPSFRLRASTVRRVTLR